MTLLGLSLAIGLLIDDAVVVRENIFKHLERGEPPFEAALNGTKEIALSVLATTFTIVAVFVPVAFMEGMMGQFFREFGLTVSAAVLLSLFVAFTLDPMLSARFSRTVEHKTTGIAAAVKRPFQFVFAAMDDFYRGVLGWVVRHKLLVGLFAIGSLVGTMMIAGIMGQDFVNAQDRGQMSVELELPAGTSLEETSRLSAGVEQALLQDPLITTVLSTLGADGEANKARLRVLAVPKQQRTIGIDALKDKVRALAMAVPRAKVVITEPAFVEGAGVQAPIMILVNGTSYDSLSKTARDIGLILESMAMGAMIGIILLMGLVTKNAILLVDRAIVRVREQGETPLQAILEAGPERLRPILMTSAAMVLGMLPTAISQGDGSEFRAPMAIAVIGGVISSTMLSLLVIPACYLGIENAKGWLAQKLGWKGKTSSPAAPAMPAATDSTASGAE